MSTALDIAVIGGGPAGLKAAETALSHGTKVTIYDAKPSLGRKFLVAGKSGLNLTSDASHEAFMKAYASSPSACVPLPNSLMEEMLKEFSNAHTRAWAKTLGIDTFVSAGNKVFPEQMKAAPLLRRWLLKLKENGVTVKVNHSLSDIEIKEKITLKFGNPELSDVAHDKVILALGGGSWKNTGSTGSWVSIFEKLGVSVIPLSAANCGWEVAWPTQVLEKAEGLPIKNIVIHTDSEDQSAVGEIIVTKYGLEGAPIYKLGRFFRQSPVLWIDLKPSFSVEQLIAKMESVKKNIFPEAIRRWKLHPATAAILEHYHQAQNLSITELAELCKHCRIDLLNPRPIDEAISSAGGVCWSELNENLSLIKYPNLYLAGEMIDWEAPTGGFLLQACLATGFRAATRAFSF
ncbi:NAD(P)/FAD-dependent oxidoreductase [Akkermansiaceae bacterium]|nr:NAD(P)/FAD-dependent oxidoreductase [Akkermansiaceae bacterium]